MQFGTSVDRARSANREHAKRTRARKKSALIIMQDRLENLKEEADELQHLLIRSKTADILLGFSKIGPSPFDNTAKENIAVTGQVTEGSISEDPDSDSSYGQQTNAATEIEGSFQTDSGRDTKKRKIEQAGLQRMPSSGTLKKLGIKRASSSISLSDLSARVSDAELDHSTEREGSPHSQTSCSDSTGSSFKDSDLVKSHHYSIGSLTPVPASPHKGNESIIDKLRSHVRTEIRQQAEPTRKNISSGLDVKLEMADDEVDASVSVTDEAAADQHCQGRPRSGSVFISEYPADLPKGSKSQVLKKERNRVHAKLTRDRKKLFTTKMSEVIAYLEQENKRRRQKLVELGVFGAETDDARNY